MNKKTVTVCNSLRLISAERVMRFARIGGSVTMLCFSDPEPANETPGSIKISYRSEDGLKKRSITYNRTGNGAEIATELEALKADLLVATYIDEMGRTRVAGSPDWPLTLDFTDDGGVFTVTLEGEDISTDPFLEG